MTGYKHALALCQKISQQIGNGVSLTGTRWSLHHHSIIAAYSFSNFKLLPVGFLRKQYIYRLTTNSSQFFLYTLIYNLNINYLATTRL